MRFQYAAVSVLECSTSGADLQGLGFERHLRDDGGVGVDVAQGGERVTARKAAQPVEDLRGSAWQPSLGSTHSGLVYNMKQRSDEDRLWTGRQA